MFILLCMFSDIVSCNEPSDLSCIINIEYTFVALQFDNWIEVK